jgi:hypothetical protein
LAVEVGGAAALLRRRHGGVESTAAYAGRADDRLNSRGRFLAVALK